MRIITAVLLLAFLPACQGVQRQEGTALVQGVQALEAEYLALSEGFEKITLKSMGDSAKKEILLARIRESRENFGRMAQQLVATTSAMMRVDYATLYNQIAATYYGIRYPGQQPPVYYEVTVP